MSTKNIGLLFARAEKDSHLACQMSSLQGESIAAFVNRLVKISEKARLPFTVDELTAVAQAAIRGELPTHGLPTLPRASAYELN